MLGYNFEIFAKRTLASARTPTLTVGKRRLFSINRAAYEALGKPPAVELMFDKGQKVLGIRPTDPSLSHAYRVRAMNRGVGVGGAALIAHYNIEDVVGYRYPATVRDGVLIVDFKEEGTEIISPRGKKQS